MPDDPRTGLTADQAATRLLSDGPNTLPTPGPTPLWRAVGAELTHPFALLLWVAAVLAVLADLRPLAVAVVAVVLANATFSFVQRRRADCAAQSLRALMPTRVTVRRDRRPVTLDAVEVVVGDVLLLEAGDRVPADARLLVADELEVDTSALTGESVPGSPEAADPVHAGCFVVGGAAEALVTATGGATRLASIARATTAVRAMPTPLGRELARVVHAIGAIAVAVGAAFFGLSVLLGRDLPGAFELALGVTVALVPEALLPTVTLALAWGAEQMAGRRVLVRSLEAVETLGSATFICTDKTGTLTRNEMAVAAAWTPAGTAGTDAVGYHPDAPVVVQPGARGQVEALAVAATRCSRGYAEPAGSTWRAHGDPMEAAIDAFARRLGLDTEGPRSRSLTDRVFAFDPHRRRMSVVTGSQVLAKGAPDAVLPLCADPPALLAQARERAEAMSRDGLRVIAVAARDLDGAGAERATSDRAAADRASAERGLRVLGLLGLHDPPRDDVAGALAACRRAGIRVAMVTGDHPATAAAIADRVGLRPADGPVLVGAGLPQDDAALGDLLDRDGVVVARVSPEDKLRIARVLQARGHVVAMTGDGVNDGPALRAADIGVAMGASGTDVARQAADLVLLDDHFGSIVAGIELGRASYLNVRRFLTYHLTDNVAELAPFVVWGLTGGSVPLALGVLQILALDLGTDTLSAVALGAEPPGRHILAGPPVSGRLLDRTVLRRAFGLLGPLEAALTLAAFAVALWAGGWAPGTTPSAPLLATASGAAFTTVVLAQTANAFACRSASRPPWALGWFSNRLLAPAAILELVFSAVALGVPALAVVLGHTLPTGVGWVLPLAAGPVLLAVDAAAKRTGPWTLPADRRRGPGWR